MTASEARRILRARPGTYSGDLVSDSRAVLARPAQNSIVGLRQTVTDAEAEATIRELRALALSLRSYRLNLGSVSLVTRAGER